MLTELSGISLPELLTESVSEETNANVPEPITEDEPVRAYTPELLYIDRPLVFPVPIFIHKHERTISRIVVPKLLNHQCIALLFVSMMLPKLLRRYVWGTIRPKANADELFGAISDVFTPKVIIESETEQKRQTSLNYSHFKRIITYINELLWKRINKPKKLSPKQTGYESKVYAIRLDIDLVDFVREQPNMSKFINELIRKEKEIPKV